MIFWVSENIVYIPLNTEEIKPAINYIHLN
jgi:hypothetical protein